jgi:hypothetical protein
MFTNFKKVLILFVLIFNANLVVSCDWHRDFLRSPIPDASACGMSYDTRLAPACLEFVSRQAESLAKKQITASNSKAVLLAPAPVRSGIAGCWGVGPCSPGAYSSTNLNQVCSNDPFDPSNYSRVKSPIIAASPTGKK